MKSHRVKSALYDCIIFIIINNIKHIIICNNFIYYNTKLIIFVRYILYIVPICAPQVKYINIYVFDGAYNEHPLNNNVVVT